MWVNLTKIRHITRKSYIFIYSINMPRKKVFFPLKMLIGRKSIKIQWVNEWLFSNFSAKSWRENKFSMKWWWDPLCSRPTRLLVFFFIVLAHWNNNASIEMSPHSDTLSWFRASQYLLFLLNAACLAEKNPKY